MDHKSAIQEIARVLDGFFRTRGTIWAEMTDAVAGSLEKGHKIYLFGNGGSAAEAQHFAAELVNRFMKERRAIPAIALTADTSSLTAIANDAAFERIFSRQIEAFGARGDVAIGLSTSGKSENVREGLRAARAKGMVTVALTGKGGGLIAAGPAPGLVDFLLDVPSASTPRVQEAHLVLLHLLAEEIEKRLG
ncbi:MAG: SIS domain-containing protein [Candidatus Aminicenantales bacterium]|jgi:D-sedoheptulose 7-phosphate isomerase